MTCKDKAFYASSPPIIFFGGKRPHNYRSVTGNNYFGLICYSAKSGFFAERGSIMSGSFAEREVVTEKILSTLSLFLAARDMGPQGYGKSRRSFSAKEPIIIGLREK